MYIELWTIGKTRVPWLREGEREFVKKCTRYATLQHTIIPAEKSGNAEYLVSQESARLSEKLDKAQGMPTILLDEAGKQFGSVAFAHHIQRTADSHGGKMRFIIGGAYGVSDSIKGRVKERLALSNMTFPHELVRIIFLEQLYRAFTILRGQGYHHS